MAPHVALERWGQAAWSWRGERNLMVQLKAQSGAADVTTVTEPRPGSSRGLPPRRPSSPPPSRPDPRNGASLPPEPVDLLLRKYREREGTGGPSPHPDTGPVDAVVSPPPRSDRTPDDPEWTFRPDGSPEPGWPYPAYDPAHATAQGHRPRRRSRHVLQIGAVVILGALITGGLALTHVGPFHSSPPAAATPTTLATPADIRGSWNALNAYSTVFYVATMHITKENLSSGKFSGTITSPVGIESMKGTVTGSTLIFTITLGTGSQTGSAVLSSTGGKTKIQGSFTNASGGHGTIVATRTSS